MEKDVVCSQLIKDVKETANENFLNFLLNDLRRGEHRNLEECSHSLIM